MTTRKTFKGRVRTRMAKTGEQYSAARQQLIDKADRRATGSDPAAVASSASDPGSHPDVELPVSDEAVRSNTGRGWDEWFAVLDAWGATQRRHPEIARWLGEEHGVAPWWRQSVTVGYERSRGMRAVHQVAGGYSIGANRTVAVPATALASAFTDAAIRGRWLPGASLRRRPSRAAGGARFTWAEDGSVVVLDFVAKTATKSQVALRHEKLPDADAAARMKAFWRERLGALKEMLEG